MHFGGAACPGTPRVGAGDPQLHAILELRRRTLESDEQTCVVESPTRKQKEPEWPPTSQAAAGPRANFALPRLPLHTITDVDGIKESSPNNSQESSVEEKERAYSASESDFSVESEMSTEPSSLQPLRVIPLTPGENPSKAEVALSQQELEALQFGAPTHTTKVLATAERARRWLMGFTSISEAVDTFTQAASNRSPKIASEMVNYASHWVLDELHCSFIAVEAYAKPELLSGSPDASNDVATALRRGRPSLTTRTVAKVEHARQGVLGTWKVVESLASNILRSPLAEKISASMQHSAAIVDTYQKQKAGSECAVPSKALQTRIPSRESTASI